MQLFHRSTRVSAAFDDSNLVSAAGLVPAMALAVKTCLGELADQWLWLGPQVDRGPGCSTGLM